MLGGGEGEREYVCGGGERACVRVCERACARVCVCASLGVGGGGERETVTTTTHQLEETGFSAQPPRVCAPLRVESPAVVFPSRQTDAAVLSLSLWLVPAATSRKGTMNGGMNEYMNERTNE